MKEFERDVVDRLARIETIVGTKVADLSKKVSEHEDRLDSGDKRSWFIGGLSMAIATVAPGLATKFGLL